ncbi:CDP-alcohol phosphatidyltransferase family protein [Salibacter sp.]|uniref:CDP-alcohol phosphatidyltransferase family protein n=1 Tax=Salibacter sp. TaxID=2010995 RepID=UPI002870AFBD|nr:CDP-alcohol phosphatidyltransferase family protein [Salibacter sp.]MDR9398046.1 CDP-alcohol phosphatidyltransferase family protein [Salibacter sp.]MDR9486912.1 CDP-alcohol phosphatidyltransferase family protein [Salibacter sp.]
MNWRAAIPNSLTLSNLVCGCLGIIAAFEAEMLWSTAFILLAAIFDFFDGMVARLLKVSGELGKQLDSLADAVTFGVLPGILLYQWISIGFGDYFTPFFERPLDHQILEGLGLLVAVFSVLRLAIFNIDERQSDVFIGVPTPANAILISSFSIIMATQYGLNFYNPLDTDEAMSALVQLHYWWQPYDFHLILLLWNPWFHIVLAIVSSILLVAPFPLLNFKFKNLKWEGPNKARIIFIGLVFLALIMTWLPYQSWFRVPYYPYFDYTIIPIIILLYIIYSLIIHLVNKARQ